MQSSKENENFKREISIPFFFSRLKPTGYIQPNIRFYSTCSYIVIAYFSLFYIKVTISSEHSLMLDIFFYLSSK